MLALFAWTGCFLAVASLNIVQRLVALELGVQRSRLFVLGAVLLSGQGVYIGRFLRWNSWDVLVRPHAVLTDIIRQLSNPFSEPRAYGVTLLFAALLLLCYLTNSHHDEFSTNSSSLSTIE
jgi:uncharacterized membrane protein